MSDPPSSADLAAAKDLKADTLDKEKSKSADCRSSCPSINLEEDSDVSALKSNRSTALVSKKISKPSVDNFKAQ